MTGTEARREGHGVLDVTVTAELPVTLVRDVEYQPEAGADAELGPGRGEHLFDERGEILLFFWFNIAFVILA